MKTIVTKPTERYIQAAADLIKHGELVAFPTETVYGLGADAFNPDAVKRIFEAKRRPADNPLISHICPESDLSELVDGAVPPAARDLMRAYWPGPMTLVLPKSNRVPDIVSAGLNTVGIRMPDNVIALELIRMSGCPIAAPSANSSGRPSPTNAADVYEDMNGRIPMIIDGGECRIGLESTVISFENGTPHILRPGGITPEMIEAVTGRLEIDEAVLKPITPDTVVRSPGMKYRHYAPKGQLILIRGEEAAVIERMRAEYAAQLTAGKKVCLLLPNGLMRAFSDCDCIDIGDGAAEASHRLFAALRELDRRGIDIAYCPTFDTDGIGLALMNRLSRAAGFNIINIEVDSDSQF